MLTDEEIKKIAYYICEKRHKEEEVSDSTTFLFPIDIYVDILTKLSERYCIVPKSKLAEKVKNTKWMKDHGRAFEADVREDLITDLFGKDMFEEDKK